MFGNDVNKKTGKPVKGYRYMCFTFFMIIILCIIVIYHDSFEKIKKESFNKMKEELEKLRKAAMNEDDKKPDKIMP